jgi:hypothetical protein
MTICILASFAPLKIATCSVRENEQCIRMLDFASPPQYFCASRLDGQEGDCNSKWEGTLALGPEPPWQLKIERMLSEQCRWGGHPGFRPRLWAIGGLRAGMLGERK